MSNLDPILPPKNKAQSVVDALRSRGYKIGVAAAVMQGSLAPDQPRTVTRKERIRFLRQKQQQSQGVPRV